MKEKCENQLNDKTNSTKKNILTKKEKKSREQEDCNQLKTRLIL